MTDNKLVSMRCLRSTAAVFLALVAAAAHAGVIADTAILLPPSPVYSGTDGPARDLLPRLAAYRDPLTLAPLPITRPDGSPLVVGDVSRGQSAGANDQLGIQRFLVTGGDASLQIRNLGLGVTAARDTFGVYHYDATLDPFSAPLTLLPLFTTNVSPANADANFVIPGGHAFGFYLTTSFGDGPYYTETSRSADHATLPPGVETTHFLFFNTNLGLVLTAEDIGYKKSTGKMGDQDFNDILVRFSYADGTPISPVVPEPASVALLIAGIALILPWSRLLRRRRDR